MYRSMADEVAAAATAAGATVVKAYTPSATWANVKTAVAGANVIVYFGHGNGYPNPYGSNELTDRSNGWGLNTKTTNGDADSWANGTLVYCGERALLGTLTASDDAPRQAYCGGTANDGIAPAPNFTMVYAQAHYAPGFGERYAKSTPLTTLDEARQRVRHYSYPILQLGGTYIATAYGDADEIVSRVLTQPTQPFADLFASGRGWSASTAVSMAHPDVSAHQVWVQRTSISGLHFGEPDYWYAFAGQPSKTPAGGSATPATPTPPTTPPPSDVERLAGIRSLRDGGRRERRQLRAGCAGGLRRHGCIVPRRPGCRRRRGSVRRARAARLLERDPRLHGGGALPASPAGHQGRRRHGDRVERRRRGAQVVCDVR